MQEGDNKTTWTHQSRYNGNRGQTETEKRCTNSKTRAAADMKEPFVRNTGKQMVKREEI